MKAEIVKNKEEIFKGPVFDIVRLDVEVEDGSQQNRDLLLHRGGACIVAINEKHEIYLVRQYRIAVEQFSLEVPAGKLELGEDPIECAYRELEEECGVRADKLELLNKFFPTPGYSNEAIYIYYCDSYQNTEQNLDDGEFLEVYKVHIDDAYELILKGEIKDAKTIIAIMLAWRKVYSV